MQPGSPTSGTASRTIAVMQPYLFPYLGYFELVAAVDRFVFYDDVAFIKNGWINRNRWLLAGEVCWFTVPVREATSSCAIRDVRIVERGPWRRKLLTSMRQHYRRAPYFAPVSELVESVFEAECELIAALAKTSVRACSKYLGLDPPDAFVDSSARYGNAGLRGAARVLDICEREQAGGYLNLPAGRTLYDPQQFQRRGVALQFTGTEPFEYRQPASGFVPGLSIIDVLMHNGAERVRAALRPATAG